MRILHTADWHVGQGIRGRSRADEHRDVLNEIAEIAEREAVDLVLVTGDQFHSAAPSPESERIVYEALMKLASTGAHVHVVAGNHDNPSRLQAVAPLLKLANVTANWIPSRAEKGGVVEVVAERTSERALIASIPFLSKRTILKADDLMNLDASRHEGKYRERYRQIVEVLTKDFGRETVNLVAAHVTTQGGARVGGERESQSILDYVVPASVFPTNTHYVGLGHLHGAQRIDAGAPVWYPGSPLRMDFGDSSDMKCVLLIDAVPGKPARVSQVKLNAGRSLVTWKGSLELFREKSAELSDVFIRVRLTDPRRPGLADEVRDLHSGVVEIALVDQDSDKDEDDLPRSVEDLYGSPRELFAEFLAEQGIDDNDLTRLFDELLEEANAS